MVGGRFDGIGPPIWLLPRSLHAKIRTRTQTLNKKTLQTFSQTTFSKTTNVRTYICMMDAKAPKFSPSSPPKLAPLRILYIFIKLVLRRYFGKKRYKWTKNKVYDIIKYHTFRLCWSWHIEHPANLPHKGLPLPLTIQEEVGSQEPHTDC